MDKFSDPLGKCSVLLSSIIISSSDVVVVCEFVGVAFPFQESFLIFVCDVSEAIKCTTLCVWLASRKATTWKSGPLLIRVLCTFAIVGQSLNCVHTR